MKLFVFYVLILATSKAAPNVHNTFERIFGTGQVPQEHKEDSEQFISASMEDLIDICKYERSVQKYLTKSKSYQKSLGNSTEDCETFMLHPLNSFQVLTRMAKFVSKMVELPTQYKSAFSDQLVVETKATEGIFNIQDLYQINPLDIAKSGEILGQKSDFRLKSSDLYLLVKYSVKDDDKENYENNFEWAKAAYQLAKEEKRPKSDLRKFKDLYLATKNIYELMSKDLLHKMGIETEKSKSIKMFKDQINSRIGDLRINHTFSDLGDFGLISELIAKQRMRKLCQDDFQRSAKLDIGLKCQLLHQKDPYFRLGPMKYERLNLHPEVNYIFDFISDEEIDKIISKAKGKLYTTPYLIDGKVHYASKYRNSKVKYINEKGKMDKNAFKISQRIEQMTKFSLLQRSFDSENYQIMNYGLGGRISRHTDSGESNIDQETTTEYYKHGGPRIMTFMTYLSDVQIGGHTIFPFLGLSVKPLKGSALFWFNFDADMSFSRIIEHMGCPVVFGNKWIANKWIKLNAQFRHYKCSQNKTAFSIL